MKLLYIQTARASLIQKILRESARQYDRARSDSNASIAQIQAWDEIAVYLRDLAFRLEKSHAPRPKDDPRKLQLNN